MIELKTKIRKWGHSFGIVIPLSQAKEFFLKEGNEVHVIINSQKKENNLRWLWGSSKSKTKKSTLERMKEIDNELYN
jgi:antitoxin component of MazEF toxin-antitoxin module